MQGWTGIGTLYVVFCLAGVKADWIKDNVFNEKDVQSTLAMLKGKLNVNAVFVCWMQEHSFSVLMLRQQFSSNI